MGQLASAMMLVALIMRAMLPQGWMPSADGAGPTGSFTICSITGSVRLTLDGNGNPVPVDPDESTAHQPCAFASLASLAPPVMGAVTQPPLAYSVPAKPAAPQSVHDNRRTGPTGPRAPPSQTRRA